MLVDACQQLMDAAEKEDTADEAEDAPEAEEPKEEPAAEEPGKEEPVKAEEPEPVKEVPPTAKGGRKIDVGKLFALYEGGWMPEEIARDLGCSVAAVKYHLDKKKKGARK